MRAEFYPETIILLTLIREGLGRIIIFFEWITRKKPLLRSHEHQQRVDLESQHLALYQFYACPFCIKVRRQLHNLRLPIALHDAQNDPRHRQELESEGGKIKVPCLRINNDGHVQWLYESKVIIAYLQQRFGA